MRELSCYTLDVFTEQVFGGNQLAVFADAVGQDGRWILAQGEDMSCPGRISLATEPDGSRLRNVHVGGSAIFVSHGILTVY